MDFNSVIRGALPKFASNMTGTATNNTRHVMDSLMPLLGLGGRANPLLQTITLVHNVLGARLPFDPTLLLTLLGFLWAGSRIWRQVYSSIYSLVNTYLLASIHINSGDEIYLHMMKWLASQSVMYNARSLMAETISKTAWEDEDVAAEVVATQIAPDGSGVFLNFSNQEAKAPPRFTPALGIHGFWYDGRYYRLHRKQESLYEEGGSGQMPQFKDKDKLIISTFGRSPEPIKRLLQHAKEAYYDDHHAMTVIRRPSPQGLRRYGGRNCWVLVANRPVRPMRTVVLDPEQKIQVLSDINEYLHPATPRWYANRGIPLRRGYLFHGPPGTGKTSLSFALAGVFGLDIYVISLLESTITEEDLGALFNSLPRRCVVLLEDIDTAGLTRRDDDTEKDSGEKERKRGSKGDKDGSSKAKSDDDFKLSDLAREFRKHPFSADKKEGISLSGLLNTIDGVASHEGRVLIMTTNKPEELDEALIRPGRVDLQVAFTNATQEQGRELFERMYEADTHRHQDLLTKVKNEQQQAKAADERKAITDGHTLTSSDNDGEKSDTEAQSGLLPNGADERVDVTEDDLSRIAAEFGRKIPSKRFSPAEIQGFLLKRKKNPRRALGEVGAWVEAMIRQKDSKSKVLAVQ
jgi:chaperone BCS1